MIFASIFALYLVLICVLFCTVTVTVMGLLSVLLLLVGLLYTANCQRRGTVRLVRNEVSSSSYTAGIVQIYYGSSSFSNSWGNICDDSSFASTEASVICNQLGYNGASTYGRAGTSSYGTDSSDTILDDVSCTSSNYLTLQQCSLSTTISSTCSLDSNDAYVVCYSTRIWNNPYSGQIRLQGGTYTSYGRLEVYCNGQWGTVCDTTFDSTDARVACRQLGYSDYSSYTGNLAGSSSQPIWLDRVLCSSSYTCLATCESCPSSGYSSNCVHSDDVALGCEFDTSRTSSSNTLSTCRYADDSSVTSISGGIIGGVIAAFVICCALIVGIPICICCCMGVGIGAAVRGGRNGRATVVTAGATTATTATVTTTNTSNVTAAPPPAYNQQLPPPAAYPAAGYDAEKAPYPPQQGYPAQPGYPPQEGYPPQGYAYPPQGYEAQPGYPPQQGYNYPPPAYPAQ